MKLSANDMRGCGVEISKGYSLYMFDPQPLDPADSGCGPEAQWEALSQLIMRMSDPLRCLRPGNRQSLHRNVERHEASQN